MSGHIPNDPNAPTCSMCGYAIHPTDSIYASRDTDGCVHMECWATYGIERAEWQRDEAAMHYLSTLNGGL